MSQSRVREYLVNLLTTCGQRVGLPKSPSVIFSQSSELLERESSMASSLEEVSGTPGNEPSGGAPPTDHFGVFKDFDFLEYESESIEGESSDNFNWGVRRRLLSEEREEWGRAPERSPPPPPPPPPPQAGGSAPPRADKQQQGKRSAHEDSSDDEGGWEVEGALAAPVRGGEGDAAPAHELALRVRTHSYSSASSGEHDGDRGDVTPVPRGSVTVTRDSFRVSVTGALRAAASLPPVARLHRLHNVLKDMISKTVCLCAEGSYSASGGGSAELSALLERLSGEEPPLVWAGAVAADCARVRDAIRYASLEINEHLETYFDRRECALEALEMLRSGEEVGRTLYRLIFQMLLLLETNNKMVVAVYQAALENRGVEMSSLVVPMHTALLSTSWESLAHVAAPRDVPLLQLLQEQRLEEAVAVVRLRTAERILERGEPPEDNVTSLLHVHARALMQEHPDMVAITRPVSELSTNPFMMESLYRVSVALAQPEPLI